MQSVPNKFRNFRDLGGLKCPNYFHIKNDMIFRSPELSANDDGDISFLNKIDVDYIIDFRTKEEIKSRPDFVFSNIKYINVPMYNGGKYKYIIVSVKAKIRVLLLSKKNAIKLKQNKIDSYMEMPFSKSLNIIFALMDNGKRFLFHCTEGKDRTGVTASVIEYCLGRNKEEILIEYLKSNDLRPPKDRSWLLKYGYSKELINNMSFCEHTQEELFEIAIDSILTKYGSIDNYLTCCFNVTEERKEKWKKIYLEKDSVSI